MHAWSWSMLPKCAFKRIVRISWLLFYLDYAKVICVICVQQIKFNRNVAILLLNGMFSGVKENRFFLEPVHVHMHPHVLVWMLFLYPWIKNMCLCLQPIRRYNEYMRLALNFQTFHISVWSMPIPNTVICYFLEQIFDDWKLKFRCIQDANTLK